ncbi:putative membrane-anchored protein [Acinetobacter calcoaceticus]|uniref:Putative membrane-anchored protein n=1 Tax=Acinetobacter calcoaceticus TaxID=471 RepID=A0A4R1Y2E2_ACICA|nr:putative membrane-anchored protein [Acinetobacter calcoaceticus]
MIKKYWPVLLAVLSMLLFGAIISKNEWQLNNSDRIFVRLQPVDPRSMIQGDYMRLNYELDWAEEKPLLDGQDQNSSDQNTALEDAIYNHSTVLTYVALDTSRRVYQIALDQRLLDRSATIIALKLKNPSNLVWALYPSSNSYLFAEGLAACYSRAEYAEFKVDAQGNSILRRLLDQQLKDLGCSENLSWWGGAIRDE